MLTCVYGVRTFSEDVLFNLRILPLTSHRHLGFPRQPGPMWGPPVGPSGADAQGQAAAQRWGHPQMLVTCVESCALSFGPKAAGTWGNVVGKLPRAPVWGSLCAPHQNVSPPASG